MSDQERKDDKTMSDNDLGKQEKLSQILKRKGAVSNAELTAYSAQVEAISKIKEKTAAMNEFVVDYLATVIKLNQSAESRVEAAKRTAARQSAAFSMDQPIQSTSQQAGATGFERLFDSDDH